MSNSKPQLPSSPLYVPVSQNQASPDWNQLGIEENLPTNNHYFKTQIDEAPIVRFVNQLIADAVEQGASDIHLEPYEHHSRIRIRQDGVLQASYAPPNSVTRRLVSRLKIMAGMDIAEHRLPQDGRIKWQSPISSVDLRISSCPTLYGEKLVIRILDQSRQQLQIEDLGLDTQQLALFEHALKQPYGMILVTGPTGSGKTVSLYAGLQRLNIESRNISTAEDPVEITLDGINQVNINSKIGLSFAEALRSFLRQDPDIIMVGEIRDLETAQIAIKAAQTGHLVLSTLHTNDAPASIARLQQMGVENYQIASALQLVIAQRLVRLLCPGCKQSTHYPYPRLIAAGFDPDECAHLQLFRAQSCHLCLNGYKGRTGIYQIMPVTPELRECILHPSQNPSLVEHLRNHQLLDLRQAGLEKVRHGLTSLEEVERMTREF
ncbi:MAG: type IV-A pilus assembly ATPase PilB [Methylococcaceae bacterium]|nr:type IV-A pilus assembly ATPase PilB [Methylococcaceae bacterium]